MRSDKWTPSQQDKAVADVTLKVCVITVFTAAVFFVMGMRYSQLHYDPYMQENFPCQEDQWLGFSEGEVERTVCVGRD